MALEFMQKYWWKNMVAKLYGFGAAIVLVGALFKIMHWPFAGLMLPIGTAIAIFGFLPLFFYTSYKEQVEKNEVPFNNQYNFKDESFLKDLPAIFKKYF